MNLPMVGNGTTVTSASLPYMADITDGRGLSNNVCHHCMSAKVKVSLQGENFSFKVGVLCGYKAYKRKLTYSVTVRI